ncbi:MAG: hypothetical protein IH851_05605 [Armatimonadetes bacterium]|nr:hypothetical protein [Armatimonadota bacterium]
MNEDLYFDRGPGFVLLGFFVSIFVGGLVLWLLIDRWAWPAIGDRQSGIKRHPGLTVAMGMIERGLYTAAIIAGMPAWIYLWLFLKVVVRWSRWTSEEPAYNVFLIGSALSLIFAVIGAMIGFGSVQWLVPIQYWLGD